MTDQLPNEQLISIIGKHYLAFEKFYDGKNEYCQERFSWAKTKEGELLWGVEDWKVSNVGLEIRLRARMDRPFPQAHKLDEAMKRFSSGYTWSQSNDYGGLMTIEGIIPHALMRDFNNFMLNKVDTTLEVFHFLGDT